ncbi:MAG: protein disulfide oxidoreductase [Chromatiales bacterium]|jgi:thiol-disulfide isomerase/thioredoxin
MFESHHKQGTDKRKRLLRWLAEGLVFLLVIYLIHLWQTKDSVVGAAPPLDAPLLSGGHFSLEQRAQKPLLVYFWASWCPQCALTSGSVNGLAEEHAVISVAMKSGGSAEVAQHLAEKGLEFPVIMDPEGVIAKAWGVRGVPTFFILDAENQIRYVSAGYTSTPGLITRMWLAD